MRPRPDGFGKRADDRGDRDDLHDSIGDGDWPRDTGGAAFPLDTRRYSNAGLGSRNVKPRRVLRTLKLCRALESERLRSRRPSHRQTGMGKRPGVMARSKHSLGASVRRSQAPVVDAAGATVLAAADTVSDCALRWTPPSAGDDAAGSGYAGACSEKRGFR